MPFLGCSFTVQSPQGSVSGQFNVDAKAGSISSLSETVAPGESLEIPFSGDPLVLSVQSDFPCQLHLQFPDTPAAEEGGEPQANVKVVELGGQRKQQKMFAYVDGFGEGISLAGLQLIQVVNVGKKVASVKSIYAARK
jgi:hypothetical protein